MRYDLLILGGGFAGTLLGRVMAAEGARVAVVERETHPRFALGESTTPLANLALERLAERHGFADLHSLAAHGRLVRDLPQIRHGLKRGFTFYRHGPGPQEARPERALFAASPDDEIADTHWLREDVDAFLAERARDAGVEVLEGTEVVDLDVGRRAEVGVVGPDGTRRRLAADRVVDATGGAGLVARRLRLEGPSPLPFPTGLVAAHVPWKSSSLAETPEEQTLPYPPESAAIHHLLDRGQASGWIYVLPFENDDRASVGLVLRGDRVHPALGAGPGELARALSTPGRTFRRVLDAHPRLRLEDHPLGGWITASPLAFRRSRAAGERFFLLPGAYAFLDPLFSTGIAWSLLGVERLRDVLLGARDPAAYDELLATEADQMERLIGSAWRAMDGGQDECWDAFVAVALCYFGAVSWSETLQRLEEGSEALGAWNGFLGAGDPVLERAFRHVHARLRAAEPVDGAVLRREVLEHLRERDVAGLDRPAAPNVFPVDLDVLLARAGRLGRTRSEIEERLHRFRGVDPPESR